MDRKTNDKPFQRKELLVNGTQEKAYAEQLREWVRGRSYHLIGKFDSCCPDFSCCDPDLLADKVTRETFAMAWKQKNTRVTEAMLMSFLSKFMAKHKVNARIIGSQNQDAEQN